MRVKPLQERQMVAARRSLVRFALSQNTVSIGLQNSADCVQPLLRRSFTPVGPRDAMKGGHERIRTLHMIGLMLEQRIVGMVVKLLNQANEHIGDIVQRAGRLNDNQRRTKRQLLWICTIVDRIERPRFDGELFDLDIRENLGRDGLFAKPFQMFEEITRVLGGRLFRLLLQPVP